MELFHIIEGANVILQNRGIYKQAKVFRRGADIYAGTAGGYVRLYGSSATSVPRISWHGIDENEEIEYSLGKQPKYKEIVKTAKKGKK